MEISGPKFHGYVNGLSFALFVEIITINGWILSLPTSSNYFVYGSTIYSIFMNDNPMELIFNSASIFLQYHMHGFIGFTVFIRSITIMMALSFYVVHTRCWKIMLKIQNLCIGQYGLYRSLHTMWICYPKRSVCLQLHQELVTWLVHKHTQRKLSSM